MFLKNFFLVCITLTFLFTDHCAKALSVSSFFQSIGPLYTNENQLLSEEDQALCEETFQYFWKNFIDLTLQHISSKNLENIPNGIIQKHAEALTFFLQKQSPSKRFLSKRSLKKKLAPSSVQPIVLDSILEKLWEIYPHGWRIQGALPPEVFQILELTAINIREYKKTLSLFESTWQKTYPKTDSVLSFKDCYSALYKNLWYLNILKSSHKTSVEKYTSVIRIIRKHFNYFYTCWNIQWQKNPSFYLDQFSTDELAKLEKKFSITIPSIPADQNKETHYEKDHLTRILMKKSFKEIFVISFILIFIKLALVFSIFLTPQFNGLDITCLVISCLLLLILSKNVIQKLYNSEKYIQDTQKVNHFFIKNIFKITLSLFLASICMVSFLIIIVIKKFFGTDLLEFLIPFIIFSSLFSVILIFLIIYFSIFIKKCDTYQKPLDLEYFDLKNLNNNESNLKLEGLHEKEWENFSSYFNTPGVPYKKFLIQRNRSSFSA
ncbi:hypothetical protein AB834_01940 [PVC group bacterium (ex Bugula neritina AB1)]|nr:hypothetical protein AB834_01940 [PVC group bacterium (ex Bugula neritina AB1)]